MFHYNYVVFNSGDDSKLKRNTDGYYTICLAEAEKHPNVKVVSRPLDYLPYPVRALYTIHTSAKLAHKVNLPFKNKWYPYYFKNDFKNDLPLCFIILNHSLPISYFEYLKNRYPDCRIALLHRDLLKVCKRSAPNLPMNPILDLEMTFDVGESKQYGFPHFNEFESLIDLNVSETPESDVYFAGKGKDRLPLLMKVYDKLTAAGLNCSYYLTGVPSNQQINKPGIVYADRFMTYREMLQHTVNSRCILEINQGGADGYTSRFLEAVMYNKKLLTNNHFIKQSKFYRPDYIQCFDDNCDIDPSFIKESAPVDFGYNGEFSPLRMIERVDEELVKKFGEQNGE